MNTNRDRNIRVDSCAFMVLPVPIGLGRIQPVCSVGVKTLFQSTAKSGITAVAQGPTVGKTCGLPVGSRMIE